MYREEIVTTFPLPYISDATPYKIVHFDNEVNDFCDQQKLLCPQQILAAKCIVVGDIAVGKTCLVRRYRYDDFRIDHKVTVGVDFEVQKFLIFQIPFELQIWDTASQERFKCIATSYYRAANAALIVFDLSNIYSLMNTRKWYKDVMDVNFNKQPLLFLVGAKKDCVSQATLECNEKEALRISRELNAEYWSISSKSGENVNELFQRIAVLVLHDVIWSRIEYLEAEKRAEESYKGLSFYADNFISLKKKKSLSKFKSCFSLKQFFRKA